MYDSSVQNANARSMRIAIVVSRYHTAITDALRDGAIDRFRAAEGDESELQVVTTPGAFELTAVCNALARRPEADRPDGIAVLGCVVTGETRHDEYICQAVAQGLTAITVRTSVPIAFGLLTCRTLEQAEARAGGEKGNKGAEAMTALIQTIAAIRSFGADAALVGAHTERTG